MKKIDMSSEAISRRIKQVDQLREVSLSLMKARKLTAEELEELRSKPEKKSSHSSKK
jgi:hypothetical protein